MTCRHSFLQERSTRNQILAPRNFHRLCIKNPLRRNTRRQRRTGGASSGICLDQNPIIVLHYRLRKRSSSPPRRARTRHLRRRRSRPRRRRGREVRPHRADRRWGRGSRQATGTAHQPWRGPTGWAMFEFVTGPRECNATLPMRSQEMGRKHT